MDTRRRLAIASVATLGALAACFNSPVWKYDAYDVEADIRGSTCSVTVGGRPVLPESPSDIPGVQIMLDAAYNVGLPDSLGVKSVFCDGLMLAVSATVDSLPKPGKYPVTSEYGFPRGTASTALFSSSVGAGAWPFAQSGVYLAGYDGVVQLDSMTRTQAWGHARFRARRQHKGE